MAISEANIRILWGRAAGRCSNPRCRDDLTILLVDSAGAYHIGEMAHIIAKRPSGPRGQNSGGSDNYDNLILLCPTCHTMIDKAPTGEYPENVLKQWKKEHEDQIRSQGIGCMFGSPSELKSAVTHLLRENRSIWNDFGPRSEIARSDPGSNLYLVWHLRRGDTILPNNHKIINLVEGNVGLLSDTELEAFFKFKNHALAFQKHCENRLDLYPTFPPTFEESFRP